MINDRIDLVGPTSSIPIVFTGLLVTLGLRVQESRHDLAVCTVFIAVTPVVAPDIPSPATASATDVIRGSGGPIHKETF